MVIFLNSVNSAAALVFYLSLCRPCTHRFKTESSQSPEYILKFSKKNTKFMNTLYLHIYLSSLIYFDMNMHIMTGNNVHFPHWITNNNWIREMNIKKPIFLYIYYWMRLNFIELVQSWISQTTLFWGGNS